MLMADPVSRARALQAAGNLQDVNAPERVIQPQIAVALAEGEPPYIVLARPLSELGAHLVNLECPSLQLLARAVKTLFMALFTWHLCDEILLPQPNNALFISLNGRIEHIQRPHLDARYPHLFEKAIKLTFNRENRDVRFARMDGNCHLENSPAITPGLANWYFQRAYMQYLSPAMNPTIYDLLTSPFLVEDRL